MHTAGAGTKITAVLIFMLFVTGRFAYRALLFIFTAICSGAGRGRYYQQVQA